jgi:hypothetical protein
MAKLRNCKTVKLLLALCPLHSALGSWLFALCPLHSALGSLPSFHHQFVKERVSLFGGVCYFRSVGRVLGRGL